MISPPQTCTLTFFLSPAAQGMAGDITTVHGGAFLAVSAWWFDRKELSPAIF